MNAACTAEPAIIVVPNTDLDVATALKAAQSSGLPLRSPPMTLPSLTYALQCEEWRAQLHLQQYQGGVPAHRHEGHGHSAGSAGQCQSYRHSCCAGGRGYLGQGRIILYYMILL